MLYRKVVLVRAFCHEWNAALRADGQPLAGFTAQYELREKRGRVTGAKGSQVPPLSLAVSRNVARGPAIEHQHADPKNTGCSLQISRFDVGKTGIGRIDQRCDHDRREQFVQQRKAL